jgi:uncharacterized protein (DUF1015 family)
MREWLGSGVLFRSPRPSFYVYRMDYIVKGVRKSLTGFFGAVKLVELGKGVYPHEATYSKPKFDRMALLERLRANTSPIFALYNRGGSAVKGALARAASGEPYMGAQDANGSAHSLWLVEDEAAIGEISNALSASDIFIADGHHRYETAYEYMEKMRKAGGGGEDEPYGFVLMFLADVSDPGLTVLPTHRLINAEAGEALKRLSSGAGIYELGADVDIIDAINGKKCAFGLYAGGRQYVVEFKGGGLEDLHPSLRDLDVVVLDEMVLRRTLGVKQISYEMDPYTAKKRVDGGEFGACFFLNPTSVSAVEKVALSGERMPPKSTYFYPKVQTGFVMYSHSK